VIKAARSRLVIADDSPIVRAQPRSLAEVQFYGCDSGLREMLWKRSSYRCALQRSKRVLKALNDHFRSFILPVVRWWSCNVRVPVENVVGKINDGWNIAIATLMFERGTLGASLQITFKRQIERLIDLSRTIDRGGRPASEDPIIRQKLAQMYTEIEIFRLNQMRATTRMSKSGVPGPEGSIQKIFWSEMNQRMQQVAMEMLGAYGQLTRESEYAIDHGQWAHAYLRSRGNTIEAGTSEIQRNIIGHFVLGLPKSY